MMGTFLSCHHAHVGSVSEGGPWPDSPREQTLAFHTTLQPVWAAQQAVSWTTAAGAVLEQAKGGDPSILPIAGEATPGALGPVLGSQAQERPGESSARVMKATRVLEHRGLHLSTGKLCHGVGNHMLAQNRCGAANRVAGRSWRRGMTSSSGGSSGHSGAMGLGRAGALGLVLGLLLGVLGGAASEPHSLRYFHTAVSDPSPGMPQFVAVGYVDGEVFTYYDSETRRVESRVDWTSAIDDQQYWERNTRIGQNNEQNYRVFLEILRERYNQSRGSHTVQHVHGCDLLEDGSIRGFDQYGYEGRDFIAFDEDTMMFTAADAAAQITKRKWEQEGTYAEHRKYYVENTCIEWLKKHVSYRKAVLEKRERPEVRVSGMEANKILTLSCRAHGFYPRPISISWLKDGVVQEQETQRGSTVPNSDGTYHALASIDVLPGDRDKYQCRVEHASLPQPGLFSWEPQSNLIPIVAGVAVAVVAVIAALAGFAVWKSKQGKKEKGYNVAPGSDGGSNSSNTGSNPSV